MRLKARVDLTQKAIVEALRKAGWRVHSTARLAGGFPDLVAYKANVGLRLIEVKTGKEGLTADQEKFIAEGWPVFIVRSAEEALQVIR